MSATRPAQIPPIQRAESVCVVSPGPWLGLWRYQRPQYSSVSRLTARAARFFDLIQSGDRPER
jgi:hypothetical protein